MHCQASSLVRSPTAWTSALSARRLFFEEYQNRVAFHLRLSACLNRSVCDFLAFHTRLSRLARLTVAQMESPSAVVDSTATTTVRKVKVDISQPVPLARSSHRSPASGHIPGLPMGATIGIGQSFATHEEDCGGSYWP